MVSRSDELTIQILELLRQGHTQKEIALTLRKHKNTIYRHVKRIREERLYSVTEIVNKIDDKLSREIDQMQHRDLITYRRTLIPQPVTPVEIKGPIVLKWQENEPDINGEVQASPEATAVPRKQSKVQDA